MIPRINFILIDTDKNSVVICKPTVVVFVPSNIVGWAIEKFGMRLIYKYSILVIQVLVIKAFPLIDYPPRPVKPEIVVIIFIDIKWSIINQSRYI